MLLDTDTKTSGAVGKVAGGWKDGLLFAIGGLYFWFVCPA